MDYRNAKHISEGRIDCEIEHPMYGWIPYTLNPADIKNDDLLASMALADDVAAYVPPTQAEIDAEIAKQIRADRGVLLLELDAFVGNPLRWSALDADTQAAWALYRQALLDVPQQAGFPNDVLWPVYK
tara:strand:- start:396 stop:779 length:384 start_codon:yes stop_codon:yes gene_type:complete